MCVYIYIIFESTRGDGGCQGADLQTEEGERPSAKTRRATYLYIFTYIYIYVYIHMYKDVLAEVEVGMIRKNWTND